MKIAAVINDGTTINAHFGKARSFLILTVEDGSIVGEEMRQKDQCSHGHHEHGHRQGADTVQTVAVGNAPVAPSADPHAQAVAAIADCEVVLSRGMGRGMYANLQRAGIRAVLTDITDVREAVAAFLAGTLHEKPELVH
jgi:predicted Fe-Mo cluster-binding NifX family protein